MDHAMLYASSVFERIRPILLPSDVKYRTWKRFLIFCKAILKSRVPEMYKR
jgi:hypothetical protein